MQYGLMTYKKTINLGNEIQSIAARRFLPKIDHYIDHEELHLFNNPEKVKMIMNGWYLDTLEAWPPSSDIDPLLISMHFNTSVNETKDVILSEKSRDFFSSYGPVGCRDPSTLELLQENDIDAYYSGCLTLTLDNNNPQYKPDNPYIAVNVFKPWQVIKYLKTKTDMPIYDVYQLTFNSFNEDYIKDKPDHYKLTSFYTEEEKMFQAENFLTIYENASCVITDRLHCALPCLALNTPVLFIDTAQYGLERLGGLTDLVRKATFEDYKNDYSIFDVEKPPKNPDDYIKLRKDLIKRTKEFTGHINDSYLMNDSNRLYNNVNLLCKTSRKTKKYMRDVDGIINDYQNEIEKQKQTIAKQEKIIKEMQNSNSWKLTGPLRKIRRL